MFALTLALWTLCLAAPAPMPVQDAATAPLDPPPAAEAAWVDLTYNAAVAAARQQQRLLLVAYTPDWSDYSRKLRDEVLTDGAVSGELCDMICLSIDPDEARGAQLVRSHEITSFPALLVVGGDGRIEDRVDGFIPAAPLVGELRRIKAGQGTVSDFQARADAAPSDLAQRVALAQKLQAVGRSRDAIRLYQRIRADDPTGETLTGARLLLQDAIDDIIAVAGASGPAAWDLAPLQQTLAGLGNERARFEGLTRLAGMASTAGDPEASLAAWRQAWGRIPETLVLDWGRDLVLELQEQGDELDPQGRALMLEVAEQVAAWAESYLDPEGDDHGYVLTGDLTPEQWLAQRLDALAFAAFANGDVDRAVALAERCLALDPDSEEYGARAGFFLAER